MGWDSPGLARADTACWRRVLCPACASSLSGEVRAVRLHIPGKAPRDGLDAVLGTFSYGPLQAPKNLSLPREGDPGHAQRKEEALEQASFMSP